MNISSPTKSTSFIAPAIITINAIAFDPDGTVIRVEFYQGTIKIGEAFSSPFTLTWKEVPEGIYSITAVAIDNHNLKTISTAVSVVVEKSTSTINQLPVIDIITPGKDKKDRIYKKYDKLTFEATASDPDGSILKVGFLIGKVTIAEITEPPYIYVWEVPDTGIFIISVFATDNLGATSVSSELAIKISNSIQTREGDIDLYPNPNDGNFKFAMKSSVGELIDRMVIANLSGNILYEGIISGQQGTKECELSYLASGTYILFLFKGPAIVGSKVFIKR